MDYFCILFGGIAIFFAARYFFLRKIIHSTIKQMDEIAEHPERNRQLQAFTSDKSMEKLAEKINDNYKARQQERIIYQRRETQIRQEIENISHDLRTPLTSIIGYMELIQDDQTEEIEKQEYLNVIQKRARVLQGFIQDFYEISRIEGDNYPLLFDAIQVQSTLGEIAVAYYNEFEKKHIKVEVNLEDKPCYVIADKIQWNRILNNLVQNALKYSEQFFSIQQFSKDGECIIQFMNDKNQMKEEEIKLVFDRFYTGDVTRNKESTGLGLTITKLLAEKMKGKIEARIENNLFIIELHFVRQKIK